MSPTLWMVLSVCVPTAFDLLLASQSHKVYQLKWKRMFGSCVLGLGVGLTFCLGSLLPATWPLSAPCLGIGFFFALVAWQEKNLLHRLHWVWLAWGSCFVLLTRAAHGAEEGGLRALSFFLLGGAQLLFVLASRLIARLAAATRTPLFSGRISGLWIERPDAAGILLTIFLFISCSPGGAFFILEDLALASTVQLGPLAVMALVGIQLLASISLWEGFGQIFMGSSSERHQPEAGAERLFLYRWGLLAVLVAGLCPALFTV